MSIEAGTKFDRYQILSSIGTGGMGEIYLAQDTRLGRKVALKLLPARYTQDGERVRRFVQEAYAASALNHPNIITIYEIGEAEGRYFIATEFIEGTTLRRSMIGGQLSLTEILDISIQVVSALAAAHAAGIVHRDVKPENIMIRPDGIVKVLDFGLAKLTERSSLGGAVEVVTDEHRISGDTADISLDDTAGHPSDSGSDDQFATFPPDLAHETTPGVVMGTAQYMSPEQASGLRVDARTDIFSFGIVLYEMIAGRSPFRGTASREILSAIKQLDPPPLSNFRPEIPDVLEWITAKALIKDREERYQTAREMLNDLKRIQHRLGVEGELTRSRGSDSVELSGSTRTSGGLSGGKTTQDMDYSTGSLSGSRMTDFLDRKFISIARSPYRGPLLAGIAALVILALGWGAFGLYTWYRLGARKKTPFLPMQVRRFTSSGRAMRAAISPDGKYVVYAVRDAGKESLHISQVTSTNDVEVVPPADAIYRGMTFSLDGNFVYYVVQEQNDPIQSLYQVPVLGGASRRILMNIDSPITISPDGKQFAFVRRYRGRGEDALIVADLDGSREKIVSSRKGPDFYGVSGPAWSPDGKIIACPAGSNTGGRHMYVAAYSLSKGEEKPVSNTKWTSVGRVWWMHDGSGIIISAIEQHSTQAQIWHLAYPEGKPSRITSDLNDYRDMSLTADSTAMVTVKSEAHVNVWLVDEKLTPGVKQITDGVGQYNGVRGLTWTPDGRMVFVSRATGSQDLWIMDSDGSNRRRLSTDDTRADIYPAVSPDGRYIVYVSTRTGNSNLYRYNLETSDEIQLTSGSSEEFPTITADSKWVIYTDTSSSDFKLWKVSIDGGERTQLTFSLSQWPDVSPDGSLIACWYRPTTASRWQIAILPISGGKPLKLLQVPLNAEWPIPIRWMRDGHGISFAATQDGVSNVWDIPIDGGQPRQLTFFSSDQIFWFSWSIDGRHLACSRGRSTSDVVLISELK